MNERHTIPPVQYFLDYEIRATWWSGLIGWDWFQNLEAKYFARKTVRKYARYKQSMETHWKILKWAEAEELAAAQKAETKDA
jgi:hypothetical protein